MDSFREQPRDLIEISGQVEHIIYQNEANGYCVCDLLSDNDEQITLVGIMPFLAEGETIRGMGKWELHANFGRQFKIEYYEKELPAGTASILKYLSSRVIKGIGPASAVKIVKEFGEDTFDVIENHPEWLADIPGISLKKAKSISENFKSQFGVRSVMMFCRDFFGPATAVKIYKKWGGASIDIIKQNPYILCEQIHGIGFESADNIAKSLGTTPNDPERIKAGTKYVLSFNASNNGHSFLPYDKLCEATQSLLDVSREETEDAIQALVSEGKAVSVKYGKRECIYLKSYYDAEKYTSAKLDMLDKLCDKLNSSDIDKFIAQIEAEIGIEYAAKQKKAIISAVNNGVMVLTGGPGTGKTTVIRAVMLVFDRIGLRIALAAPTGRAAKRISDTTGRQAKTIHRLLEMSYNDQALPTFNKNENDLLEEDVIIIDEASMVDIQLMSALLHAIKPGAHLLLIGDSDQLPSVGAGNVLNDIISSEHFSTIKLTEIFRQASESLIVTNAHAINNGEYPDLNIKNKDFFFLPRESDEAIASTVADLCLNRLPKTYGEQIRSNIQIITPSHKGASGTDCLNSLLQSALNPPSPQKREKKVRNIIFREGDKVMQIKNNYDIIWEKEDQSGIGIFNGDIGVIEEINNANETLTVNFDKRMAIYDYTILDELDHAYAITVHKSQGSEYPVIILPLSGHSPRLLTRNLLYTAVTRATDMVIIVGQRSVIEAMVDNAREVKRYTGLCFLLREYNNM